MSSLATDNHVIEFQYTLKNSKGDILDSTLGFSPLCYIHGKNNIIPGLENALAQKKVGEVV